MIIQFVLWIVIVVVRILRALFRYIEVDTFNILDLASIIMSFNLIQTW